MNIKHALALGVIGILVNSRLTVSITGQPAAICTYRVAGQLQTVTLAASVCPPTMMFQ